MGDGKTIITIAGNMGVGKTALTDLLADSEGWEPFHEQQDHNPYIKDFYKDMKRWGFHSQLFFLSKRLELYQEMLQHNNSVVIQDRGVFEDAEVFEKNLYNQGFISERDHKLYTDFYRETMKLMPMPGFVVYLKASTETLMKRITDRGRDYEKSISRNYIEQLNNLYNEWISSFTFCPTLVIECDDLDFVAKKEDLDKVKAQVLKALEVWRQQHISFK